MARAKIATAAILPTTAPMIVAVETGMDFVVGVVFGSTGILVAEAGIPGCDGELVVAGEGDVAGRSVGKDAIDAEPD